MSGKCFEIGTLQAFLDGETTPELSLEVAEHTAECDACASLLAGAEEESSFVFAALDREMNSLVPTQRLWTRINDSIADEKHSRPFWQQALGFFSVSLANPSFAAAAGIFVVLALFAVVWGPRTDDAGNTIATVAPVQQRQVAEVDVNTSETLLPPIGVTDAPDEVASAESTSTYKVKQTNLPAEKLKALVTRAGYREPAPKRPAAEHAVVREADVYLPGEEGYIRTISELRQSIDGRKDAVLTPATRVSYERDMAVVDDSIKKLREVVRKNPRNQSAKQILYASYQDKIDLLTSVAQRDELMASIR